MNRIIIDANKRAIPARVVWLQYEGSIEGRILAAVRAKQDYTVKYFERDLFSGSI